MLLRVPFQDPIDQEPLIQEAAGFRNPRTGVLYPICNDIPVFLPNGSVEGPNADARARAAATVNSEMVTLYWSIGERIRKDILAFEPAGYDEQIVQALSGQLPCTTCGDGVHD